MARLARIVIPGLPHHVTQRGNRREAIFFEDGDHEIYLDLLAEQGPLNVTELAEEFPDLVVSGISKHLMGLRGAGLVQATREGRQQIYALEAKAMQDALTPWLRKYDRFWQQALERLRDLAEDETEEKGKQT